MKKINYKLLAIFIIIPIVIGTLVGLLTVKNSNIDSILPSWIFPVVWTILYTLMGISSYLIYRDRNIIPKIYFIQLFFNYTWVFIFFSFKAYLLAFIWIIILIVLVVLMIKEFLSLNKNSGYLQIPYLVWLLIAAILNLTFIV